MPNIKLREIGFCSEIYDEYVDVKDLMKYDVIICHRSVKYLDYCVDHGKIVGLDIGDDLLRFEHFKGKQHFTLTDSLPNTRYYISNDTYYWPHGFMLRPYKLPVSEEDLTKFVYCGYPENVFCLLGSPLRALERVAKEKKISLTIITDTKTVTEPWLPRLPKIDTDSFPVIWKEWDRHTYEDEMQKCDVGIFPQFIEKDRWKKKSIYKAVHAASLSIPAIISASEEAVSTFTNGFNVLIPKTTDDWITSVRQMTTLKTRSDISRNAYELYRSRFNIDLIVQQLIFIIDHYLKNSNKHHISKYVNRKLAYINEHITHYLTVLERKTGV